MADRFEREVMLIKVACEVFQREMKDKHYKIEVKPNPRGLFTEVTFRYVIAPHYTIEEIVEIENYRASREGLVDIIDRLAEREQFFRIEANKRIKELKAELDKIHNIDEGRWSF